MARPVTTTDQPGRDPWKQLVEQHPGSPDVVAPRPDDGRPDLKPEVVDGDHPLHASEPVLAVGLVEARSATVSFGGLAVDDQHRRFRQTPVLVVDTLEENVDDLLPHPTVPPP